MTTIRATCPTCGDVELTTKDVTVRVCAADNGLDLVKAIGGKYDEAHIR